MFGSNLPEPSFSEHIHDDPEHVCMSLEKIAKLSHEISRAYFKVIDKPETFPVPAPWDELPENERLYQSVNILMMAVMGVTPEAQHDAWVQVKKSEGWTQGEIEDETAKTHPHLVPWNNLPRVLKARDLLRASVLLVASKL